VAANLTFLGSGSAFTVGADNFQSNAILTLDNGKKFLIDCGTDIRFSLYALGLSHRDITDIYVSHLHSDHVGGLEYVGFSTMFDPNCGKPNLYLSQDIAADLWERSLAGGMEAIEGGMTEVDSYFQIHALGPGETFTWENVNFQLIKLNHVDTGSMLMPAYGLFFTVNHFQVFFSNDTKFSYDRLQEYFHRADIIFHDCEISPYPSPVHAHYNELRKLPAAIKAKMWLYGYQPGPLPPAREDGFLGFVKRGQRFDLV
jgi:ribonuclease BN (tRNA processing enzyme)